MVVERTLFAVWTQSLLIRIRRVDKWPTSLSPRFKEAGSPTFWSSCPQRRRHHVIILLIITGWYYLSQKLHPSVVGQLVHLYINHQSSLGNDELFFLSLNILKHAAIPVLVTRRHLH